MKHNQLIFRDSYLPLKALQLLNYSLDTNSRTIKCICENYCLSIHSLVMVVIAYPYLFWLLGRIFIGCICLCNHTFCLQYVKFILNPIMC